MSDNRTHKRLDLNDDKFVKSLPKVAPRYARSKEDVWAAIQHEVGHKAASVHHRSLWPIAAAAVIAMVLVSVTFLRFYTQSYETANGELLTVTLPDGSSVKMNANSELSFRPYWWSHKREVGLEGEAFFHVAKGKQFDVLSTRGMTSVLGTTFNVYARGEMYEVLCVTGKVRVTDALSQENIIILPQQKARIASGQPLQKEANVEPSETLSWTHGLFEFKATPIEAVFKAIEREYQVEISYSDTLNLSYSGKFSRDLSVEEVMKIVCRSFGLEYQIKGHKVEVK